MVVQVGADDAYESPHKDRTSVSEDFGSLPSSLVNDGNIGTFKQSSVNYKPPRCVGKHTCLRFPEKRGLQPFFELHFNFPFISLLKLWEL